MNLIDLKSIGDSVRLWSWGDVHRRLRNHGLALFGFAQEDFRHHHQLLRVWGIGRPARWEVWRWAVGTGSSDKDDALEPLPFGSNEMYHRIGFLAERVYVGRDWKAAKSAMCGVYQEARAT